MSIRLFRRPAALICSLALLPALSPAALAAGAPAVSDKKSALIRHSASFKTDSRPYRIDQEKRSDHYPSNMMEYACLKELPQL